MKSSCDKCNKKFITIKSCDYTLKSQYFYIPLQDHSFCYSQRHKYYDATKILTCKLTIKNINHKIDYRSIKHSPLQQQSKFNVEKVKLSSLPKTFLHTLADYSLGDAGFNIESNSDTNDNILLGEQYINNDTLIL